MLELEGWLTVGAIATVLTAQYWLGPIKHRQNSRRMPRSTPQFWLAGDENPVPPEVRAYLDAVSSRIASTGFTPLTPLGASGGAVTMYLQFLVHDAHPERITAAVIHATGPGGFRQNGLGVQTLHKDGRDWETSNSATARVLPPDLQRILRVPGVDDPLAMLHLHRQFVREMTKSPAVPSPERDPLAIQQRVERRTNDKMVESGWYYRDAGHCLPTWKGACLGIWINLPPWKNAVEARDRQRRARYERQ